MQLLTARVSSSTPPTIRFRRRFASSRLEMARESAGDMTGQFLTILACHKEETVILSLGNDSHRRVINAGRASGDETFIVILSVELEFRSSCSRTVSLRDLQNWP